MNCADGDVPRTIVSMRIVLLSWLKNLLRKCHAMVRLTNHPWYVQNSSHPSHSNIITKRRIHQLVEMRWYPSLYALTIIISHLAARIEIYIEQPLIHHAGIVSRHSLLAIGPEAWQELEARGDEI